MDAAGPATDQGQQPVLTKAKVMHGAQRLLGRQVAGMVISVIGMFAMARLIGPKAYGTYTAAFGIAFFLQNVGGLGIGVYLKRREGEVRADVCDQAFTLLIFLAIATVGLSLAVLPLLSDYMRIVGFEPVSAAMFVAVALVMMQQVALSRLERALDYGRIGKVEVAAQLCFFLFGLPLADAGAGAWAPVGGWWMQQIVLLGGYWWGSPYRPRLLWKRRLVNDILSYGSTSAVATVIFGLRGLTGPLIVGHFLGPTALGYSSLAVRLLEQLSMARTVISRLAIPVFSQVGADRERFRRGFTGAMAVQFLTVAAPIMSFSLICWFVVPLVFGKAWTPVATLVPLLVPAYLAMGAFYMHNLVLTLSARPYALVMSQGANAITLFIGSWLLIPIFGLNGYAYAETVVIATWILSDQLVARSFPRPRYAAVLCWFAGFSLASLAPVISWWLLLAIPLAFLPRVSRQELRNTAELLLNR